MEEEINLEELFKLFKKKARWIVLGGIGGLIISIIVTYFVMTPQYSASTQILVNRSNYNNSNLQWNDIQTDVQMINTYKDIIKGPVILNDVISKLKSDLTVKQLSERLEITSEQNSQVFSIKIKDDSPYVAADIVNMVAKVFQSKIGDIMNIQNVTQVSPATPDLKQVSPRPTLNLTIGLLGGVVLSMAVIFFIDITDKTVKDESFIVNDLEMVNLGSISFVDVNNISSTGRKNVLQPNNT